MHGNSKGLNEPRYKHVQVKFIFVLFAMQLNYVNRKKPGQDSNIGLQDGMPIRIHWQLYSFGICTIFSSFADVFWSFLFQKIKSQLCALK